MKKIYLMFILFSIAMMSNAQVPFTAFDTSYYVGSSIVRVAPSLQSKVLFRESSNYVKVERAGGFTATVRAPREHDFMAYLPDATTPNSKGTLVVNHERLVIRTERPELGNGGAVSIVPIIKDPVQGWKIDNSIAVGDTCFAVDFSTVGWTTTNCGGTLLPNGMVLTGEEIFASYTSNFQIRNNFDTLQNQFGYDGAGNYTIPANVPEFGGQTIKMFQNLGYLTMINPNTKKATRKLYHAGRMSFEGTTPMGDNRTLVHGNDYVPTSTIPGAASYVWKYVADTVGDYTKGNLFVFKQNPNSFTGVWLQIPRVLDSLIIAPTIAGRLGATMYQRIEWPRFDPVTGRVYLAETGRDLQSMTVPMRAGATVPKHWIDNNYFNPADSTCAHPYGTVLVLENALTNTPSVRPYLMGGPEVPNNLAASKFVFNSVDGITIADYGTKRYLVLQEDNIGTSLGRIVPGFVGSFPYEVPKCFFLDLSIANPTPADLHLVYTGTRDSEATGAVFTPDGSTMFINNQHPSGTGESAASDSIGNTSSLGNLYPFQRAATIAVTGFNPALIQSIPSIDEASDKFQIYPNPTFNTIHFNKRVDFVLFDVNGANVLSRNQAIQANIYGLPAGTYFLRINDGSTYKVVLEK